MYGVKFLHLSFSIIVIQQPYKKILLELLYFLEYCQYKDIMSRDGNKILFGPCCKVSTLATGGAKLFKGDKI